jgi:hypothetical protein
MIVVEHGQSPCLCAKMTYDSNIVLNGPGRGWRGVQVINRSGGRYWGGGCHIGSSPKGWTVSPLPYCPVILVTLPSSGLLDLNVQQVQKRFSPREKQ